MVAGPVRFGFMRSDVLSTQQDHLFYWSPVCLAAGIGLYFLPDVEPALWLYGLCTAVLCALVPALLCGTAQRALTIGAILVLSGFCLAGARAALVARPVLDGRYYGPVQGRVVDVDRSASDAIRITLDRVHLSRIPLDETPDRLRLTLHGDPPGIRPQPGDVVATTAMLAPPPGPVEPGGFDFQRHAWFLGLGAQGYTRKPLVRGSASEPVGLFSTWRTAISGRIRAVLTGNSGGFAAAILTGDRSDLSRTIVEDLRISNLAHLLAISGLHMGLVAGLVFGGVRLALAAIPAVALRWPIRKIAALAALVAAMIYLGVSGASVATQRAFTMAALALIAVVLERQVLSLRSVSFAALILLILWPESLLSPGFQMSFAATTALVWVYGAVNWTHPFFARRPVRVLAGVVLTSCVAGMATAPVAAAHFNHLSAYGLIANLLSVPLMGLLIMPTGLAALLLMPVHAEAIPLRVMGKGIDWVLSVAHEVASLPGARVAVVQPGQVVLPMIALGALIMLLWIGRGRFVGGALVALALLLWQQTTRPDVLISESGRLVGVMDAEGRALSAERGDGFTAQVWLENDGSAVSQARAAGRWSESPPPRILVAKRKKDVARLTSCPPDALVVVAHPVTAELGCTVIAPSYLAQSGAVSARFHDGQWHITASRGQRRWHHRRQGDARGQ